MGKQTPTHMMNNIPRRAFLFSCFLAAFSDKCTLIVKGVIPGVTANASLKLGPVMARVTDAK